MERYVLTFLLCFLCVSCGKDNKSKPKSAGATGLPDNVHLGQSTSEQVEQELGDPIRTYEKGSSTIIQSYSGGMSFQYEKNIAQGFFRDPQGDEAQLQFWLQKWRACATKREAIQHSAHNHGSREYQLICQENHSTIIYNGDNGVVKRVIFYEN